MHYNSNMKICVFAGSSPGKRPSYSRAAYALGQALAKRDITLVYGGASVGLMGSAADGALSEGGNVIGVIPQFLADVEIVHKSVADMRVVPTMHERKAQMARLSDAFITLPGGIGSLEESFEVWTWSQLGIHAKPIGLLNVDGFYDGLATFLDHLVEEAFVKPVHRGIMLCNSDPDLLIDGLLAAEVPKTGKWFLL